MAIESHFFCLQTGEPAFKQVLMYTEDGDVATVPSYVRPSLRLDLTLRQMYLANEGIDYSDGESSYTFPQVVWSGPLRLISSYRLFRLFEQSKAVWGEILGRANAVVLGIGTPEDVELVEFWVGPEVLQTIMQTVPADLEWMVRRAMENKFGVNLVEIDRAVLQGLIEPSAFLQSLGIRTKLELEDQYRERGELYEQSLAIMLEYHEARRMGSLGTDFLDLFEPVLQEVVQSGITPPEIAAGAALAIAHREYILGLLTGKGRIAPFPIKQDYFDGLRRNIDYVVAFLARSSGRGFLDCRQQLYAALAQVDRRKRPQPYPGA